jgi:hypothetical protein
MSQDMSLVIEKHFKSLPDPRRKTANQRHKFIDILVIASVGWVEERNPPFRSFH